MEKPQFEHDCNVCQFLGRYVHDNKNYDLYFCESGPTVVARYSNEGSNYLSGLAFCDVNEILNEAKQRSIKKGFL